MEGSLSSAMARNDEYRNCINDSCPVIRDAIKCDTVNYKSAKLTICNCKAQNKNSNN